MRRSPRRLRRLLLTIVALLAGNSVLLAQPVAPQGPPPFARIQAGFKPLGDENGPTYKVGLWSPLAVELLQDLAVADGRHRLHVDTEDSEDYTVDWSGIADGQRQVVNLPFRSGRTRGEVRVFLASEAGRTIEGPRPSGTAAGVGSYLYASLGAKLDDLADALTLKERRAAEDGKFVAPPSRFAVYEDNAEYLPKAHVQGYDGCDLVIVCTGNRDFLTGLQARSGPLLRWLSNGGRLVIAIDPKNADVVRDLLKPVAPIEIKGAAIPFKSLPPVESWAGLLDRPFPARGELPPLVTPLTLGTDWEVLAEIFDKNVGDRPTPLIARATVGFGAVTLITFPLDGGAFSRWGGRVEFLRTLVDQLGPRYQMAEKTRAANPGDQEVIGDWGTQLHRELDVFDVATPSFATVALLMLAYILLVSVVDHAVLKRLGRLESTWITLPLIAAGVCGLVYWWLQPEEDDQLRTNTLALVDYDLRSGSGLSRTTTWLTVRSPAIRELTLSTPVRPDYFQSRREAHAVPFIGWFGRPDDGPAGMGRGGSQSFGTKTYDYRDNFTAFEKVPFAYRGTKAFLSEVGDEVRGEGSRSFASDLVFHARTHHLKVSGTLQNQMPCDLEDVYLFVFDRAYAIEGGLKAGQKVAVAIKEIESGLLPTEWRDKADRDRPMTPRGVYNPCVALRNIMFHERFDSRVQKTNSLFRPLDWSWRLRDDPRVVNVPISSLGTREAILVARAKFVSDDAAKLAADSTSPLPTVLHVGDGPEGLLSQDTYIRVIVPLRPQL